MGDKKYSEADFPEPQWLPTIVIDASAGRRPGVEYSEADFPDVILLPEWVIDAADLDPCFAATISESAVDPRTGSRYQHPHFLLRVAAPPDTPSADVAVELKALFAALKACDAALGGAGLVFETVRSPAGARTYRVTTTGPGDEAERVRSLAALVNRADTNGRVPRELADRVRPPAGYHIEALAG